MDLILVNIGCGKTWHPAWVNMDVAPSCPEILPIDAGKPLPFSNDAVDACYNSHVLEHLDQVEAKSFLVECRRILKPGGVLRVVVPDLEGIAREYIRQLDQSLANPTEISERYDWIMPELLDQLVRHQSGGQMAKRISEASPSLRAYIKERVGKEAEGFWELKDTAPSLRSRLLKPGVLLKILGRVHATVIELLLMLVAGKKGVDAYRLGRFRMSGEVHRWMYDRYSLGLLLRECGFGHIRVSSAFESGIPNFESYGLDVAEGKPRKPDSLFMEAVKP